MRPRRHPMRRKLAPAPGAPEVLENQARRLREMAALWAATGEPPTIEVNGTQCSISVLAMLDLVDDATQLEADAAKLRKAYRTRT